jgi:hypothetical protein
MRRIENSPFRIRYAAASDNLLLAEMGAQTFADSFAEDNSPESMSAYLAAALNQVKLTTVS